MSPPTISNAGPPIRDLWAWVVTDAKGQQALCRSPFSRAAALVSPDREAIEVWGDWCRAHYAPLAVALCRFALAGEEPDG